MSASSQIRVDVLIVGAGPAGLACAIHLQRLAQGRRRIVVLEKSAQIGGHLLSGAVIRPDSLAQLLTPNELQRIPLGPPVTRDTFHALGPGGALRLPFVPPKMRMRGMRLASFSQIGSALADVASQLGVEILTSQTADSLIWEQDRVAGVNTQGDQILASTTVLAEGAGGLLARELLERHPDLRGPNPPSHSLGLKEIIEIPSNPQAVGTVAHTFGFPLGLDIYGGGFLYHFDETHVALGLALALDYRDPAASAHELFRQWKRHPFVQKHIAGGETVAYGAKLVSEGGWYSLPQFSAPGALLIGDAAGLVDTMELKGFHLAIESGIAAARAIRRGDGVISRADIPSLEGLRRTRNYRAAFRWGLPAGIAAAGLNWLTGGMLPAGRWTPREERSSLRPGKRPAALRGEPDNGPLDLGVESALFRAHLQIPNGAEHITLRDADICRDCLHRYHAPCTRFCPASVYAADPQAATAIQIRAENCLQCRCCTLKCPYDNIVWRTPRHGAGPNYANM